MANNTGKVNKKAGKEQENDNKAELLKELRKIIKDLPEEGLMFLIKQANTMIYNKKIEELNEMQDKISNSGQNSKKPQKEEEKSVSFERGSFNRSFIMVLNNIRKTIAEQEMVRLVRVAHSAKNEQAAAENIYTFLKKERDDILIDAGIKNKSSLMLKQIHKEIIKNFSLTE